MIQRIQTIFLFLAALALSLLYWSPLVNSSSQELTGVYQDGHLYTWENLSAAIAFALGIMVTIAAIFVFKIRKTQKALVLVAAVIILAGNLLAGIAFLKPTQDLLVSNNAIISPGLGAFMPIVALISLVLAYRNILKDEKIIKSMDRLR